VLRKSNPSSRGTYLLSCCTIDTYNSSGCLHKSPSIQLGDGGRVGANFFYSLFLYPVLGGLRLTSTRTPHQIFNFTSPTFQTEKRAPNRG